MAILNHPPWSDTPEADQASSAAPALILLADVDGTLLDANGRLPLAAAALRARMHRALGEASQAVVDAHASAVAGAMVGFASSRTVAELAVLQRVLRTAGPCIAEDGAVLALDEALAGAGMEGARVRAGTRTLRVRRVGASAEWLRAALATGGPAEGDVARADATRHRALGFRTSGMRRRALARRDASLLFELAALGAGGEERLRARAAELDATVHCGGRWHTVTRGAGKGNAVSLLRAHFDHASPRPLIAGIGNEENDVSLLEAVDLRFVIRNPVRGWHPSLASLDGAILLEREGTDGFLEMLDRLVGHASSRQAREQASTTTAGPASGQTSDGMRS